MPPPPLKQKKIEKSNEHFENHNNDFKITNKTENSIDAAAKEDLDSVEKQEKQNNANSLETLDLLIPALQTAKSNTSISQKRRSSDLDRDQEGEIKNKNNTFNATSTLDLLGASLKRLKESEELSDTSFSRQPNLSFDQTFDTNEIEGPTFSDDQSLGRSPSSLDRIYGAGLAGSQSGLLRLGFKKIYFFDLHVALEIIIRKKNKKVIIPPKKSDHFCKISKLKHILIKNTENETRLHPHNPRLISHPNHRPISHLHRTSLQIHACCLGQSQNCCRPCRCSTRNC